MVGRTIETTVTNTSHTVTGITTRNDFHHHHHRFSNGDDDGRSSICFTAITAAVIDSIQLFDSTDQYTTGRRSVLLHTIASSLTTGCCYRNLINDSDNNSLDSTTAVGSGGIIG